MEPACKHYAKLPRHQGGSDVDWKFTSDGIEVLLEVKFRRTDWRRGHAETVTYTLANLFADISRNFQLHVRGCSVLPMSCLFSRPTGR